MTYHRHETTLRGAPLAWHEEGGGKPVLYLHPAGGFTPSEPLRVLAGDHRVAAPVAPGFDGTARRDDAATIPDHADLLAEFAVALLGPRFDVIGSSFGAWLAVRHPALVDHLILQVPAGFRFDGAGGLPDDPAARLRALYRHPDRITAPAKPDAVVAANRQTYEAMAAATLGPRATVDAALDARLPEVRAVTLILLGTEDPVVPAQAGAHLKRQIPVSQRIFVFDAAHAVESDQPARVARIWRSFLTRGQGFVLNRGQTEVAAQGA